MGRYRLRADRQPADQLLLPRARRPPRGLGGRRGAPLRPAARRREGRHKFPADGGEQREVSDFLLWAGVCWMTLSVAPPQGVSKVERGQERAQGGGRVPG